MKKTVSFNLESDILKEIEDYKSEKDLSSRSSALERIILEWSFGKIKNEPGNRVISNTEKTEPEITTMMDKSLEDSYDKMPD